MRQACILLICLSCSLCGCVHTHGTAADARAHGESEEHFKLEQERAAQGLPNGLSENAEEDEQSHRNVAVKALTFAGAGIVAVVGTVIDVPVKAYKFFNGDKPSVAARKMEDASSPDQRRQGINDLLRWDFTKRPPYTTRYQQIAQFDSDYTVRAVALRASNRARDSRATFIFIKSLDDKNDLVRLEAAKALVNLPDPDAVNPLLNIVRNHEENRDVRIAAVDALKHYRTLPVARALAGELNDRDFGIAWQSHLSLRYLSGRDYRYDESAWLAYLTGPGKPFG